MSLDEKDRKLVEVLGALRNSFQGSAEAIDTFLSWVGEQLEPQNEAPCNKMFWEKRNGAKGLFEMTSLKNCGNVDLFRHLVATMKQNNRRFTEKNWLHYYWLGKDNDDTIFRRVKKSQTEQALGDQQAKPLSVATARDIFPKELADMLSFEETPDAWKIKPRQYLGSENFNKILAIVKQHGGEYVSEGKASHFKLPKTATKREG